jgi:DNA-binding transcriptional ArsR family regulator
MPVTTQTISTEELYARIFSALGEPIRIRIVGMIAATDELPCTVLDDTLPITKSTISYHIKTLHQAQLIHVRKAGRYYFYTLRRDVFDEFLPGLLARLRRERLNEAGDRRALVPA